MQLNFINICQQIIGINGMACVLIGMVICGSFKLKHLVSQKMGVFWTGWRVKKALEHYPFILSQKQHYASIIIFKC